MESYYIEKSNKEYGIALGDLVTDGVYEICFLNTKIPGVWHYHAKDGMIRRHDVQSENEYEVFTKVLSRSKDQENSPFDMVRKVLDSQVIIKDNQEQWTRVIFHVCEDSDLEDKLIQIVGGTTFCFGKNGEFKGIVK